MNETVPIGQFRNIFMLFQNILAKKFCVNMWFHFMAVKDKVYGLYDINKSSVTCFKIFTEFTTHWKIW